jgi:molybdopterin converting factor small subunit
MIIVRLPASLRIDQSDEIVVSDVSSITELIDAIDGRIPGFRALFEDGGFNLAVNDELLLHRVRDRVLRGGDVVEIVPTIAGGAGNRSQ